MRKLASHLQLLKRLSKFKLLLGIGRPYWISTTILERGAPSLVRRSVGEANHRLFTKSSLIQIGGRRSVAWIGQQGDLIFFHDGLNRSIKNAIKELN